MCSVNDAEIETDDELMQPDEVPQTEGAICKKCNENNAEVVLRVKDTYCSTCFLAASTHKFRATIGKSKLVRPTDSILIGHSGKAGSTVLLHLIKAGMSEAVHKRLMYKTTVLYVDDGAVLGQTVDQRKSTISAIREQVHGLGFTGYAVSLNESLHSSEPKIYPLDEEAEDLKGDSDVVDLFNAVSSYTSKEELLHKLRQKLLISVARSLGCCKVFTADGATDLAITILSNIALGRGAQLPLDVGFVDSRELDIRILRPMRDFTRKELIYYLNFHKLETIQTPGLTTKKEPYTSIQKLTEKFVTELNTEFSGTVSAIFRTGEKLSIGNLEASNLIETCALCRAQLDTVFTDTSSLQATEFSKLISAEGPKGNIGKAAFELKKFPCVIDAAENVLLRDSKNCDNCSCSKGKEKFEMSAKNFEKYLCYGCRLIFKDLDKQHSIPDFLQNSVRQRISLDDMREEIADFLL
ncbi:cytoplasmic tRNA 2-thiolation protein 2 isoform X1 [Neodiprion virginianus]|uniref:cytoplasmic tRNA 2-thiolation protein 2 isoform X1 n=2 Tax=Neodiprion virginianus TaxID=2961670 RepID=UPI001EE6D030|nr:cytoplasmic tRNA 2-thiolation protein 2 isoform X1 [Neodiprion virginianus]